MIDVCVCGCFGKMGKNVCAAVEQAEDMRVVCGIAEKSTDAPFAVYTDVEEALSREHIDVFVDFTLPRSVESTLRKVLPQGIDCVVGTTGLSNETLEELAALAPEGTCLFYAPNFTTGAVLMMQFSKIAAAYFPQAEVIEFHHAGKVDAPSGTAKLTAQLISENRPAMDRPSADAEARGTEIAGVPVHSIRSDGFVAKQEVIFGSPGQNLTITHDSWDRSSYMPGVLLGIRSVAEHSGLIVGLENFMEA